MTFLEVQITSWDKIYFVDPAGQDLGVGNYVIMMTTNGEEIGKVVAKTERDTASFAVKDEDLATLIRKAEKDDVEKALELKKKEQKTVADCKVLITKHDLPMKLVDAHYSIDNKRLTFAFIANGRVDFRVLLKDLVKHFKLNIRLQQIGIRDEIKINGDMGCCGKILCCQSFYKDLGNVTSDLADLQQVSHRGSERLSGVCGRLKCCLNYEKAAYEECADQLPPIGSEIKTKQGKGVVMGWHTLKKTVDVQLDNGVFLEVEIEK